MIRFALGISALAVMITAAPIVAQDDAAAVRRQIEATNAKLESWYRAGQIDSVATMFTADTWQLPPQMPPTIGRKALTEFWTYAANAGAWEFTIDTQDVIVSGPLAAERGTFVLKYTPGPNAPETMTVGFEDRGNYVVVWRRDADGVWRILWDAPVSELPPPQMQ